MLKQLAGRAFDISNQSSLIAGTPLGTIGGVSVYVHGNPLSNIEQSLISQKLTALTADYPDVANESVRTLRILNPSVTNPRQLLALKEIPDFRRILEQAPILGVQAMGLASAPIRGIGEDIGSGIILNNPMIRLNKSSYFTKKMKSDQMVATTSGRLSDIGEILEHEFGHHVQYHNLTQYLRATNDIAVSLPGGLPTVGLFDESLKKYHENILLPAYQRAFPQFSNMAPQVRVQELNTGNFREVLQVAKEQKRILKETGVANARFNVGETVSMLGSRYAASNEMELYAETFARARLGHGTGFAQAQQFIREVAPAADKSKMLEQVESAMAGLMRMRR